MSHPRLVALLLALVTLLVYLPVRNFEFVVYDDPEYVTQNPIVQAGLTGAGFRWAFTTGHVSNWHPVTWLSHQADCEWFGLNAGAHHLVSALLHALNAALVFVVLWRFTRKLWPAAVVAALFAWHPLRVESVAWVSERKDVLSLCFGLLTLLAYARYAEARRAARPARGWLALVCGLFALGLMAKPMLVTLPFVLLLLDWWPLKRLPAGPITARAWVPLIVEKWPLFLLTLASSVVTFLVQRAESVVSTEQHPFGLRLGNAVLAVGQYLRDTVWPVNLALLYPLPEALPWAALLAAGLVVGLLSWGAWRARESQPWLLVGWLWFLGTLVPVIGLVQVGLQGRADRYTYLPHLGLFIAVVFGVSEWTRRRGIKPFWPAALATLALAACLGFTVRQLEFWRDSEVLFRRSLEVSPRNPIARLNLGVALQQQGRLEEALAECLAARDLAPARAQVHNNLATLLDTLGRDEEARAAYEEALRLDPLAPLAHLNYGAFLAKQGRFDEARARWQEAARLAPADPRPHARMARAELRQGRAPAAVAHLRDALQRDPNDAQSLVRLARLLAANEDPAIRNGAEALAIAARANALTGGEAPVVLDVLAMACAETGRFQDARQIQRQAVELAEAEQDESLIAALRARLRLYEAGQPFREPTGAEP